MTIDSDQRIDFDCLTERLLLYDPIIYIFTACTEYYAPFFLLIYCLFCSLYIFRLYPVVNKLFNKRYFKRSAEKLTNV